MILITPFLTSGIRRELGRERAESKNTDKILLCKTTENNIAKNISSFFFKETLSAAAGC